jgi:DNA repair photolyase
VRARQVTHVSTAFSIGTVDEEAWRRTEPGTPHPQARLEAVAALNDAGVPCSVLVAPILPGITDAPAQLRAVVSAAIDAGATQISPILLHLRPGIREQYFPWLEEHYPELVPRYREMYQRPYGPPSSRKELGARVASIVRSVGGLRPRGAVAETAHLNRWRRPVRPTNIPAEEQPTQLRML